MQKPFSLSQRLLVLIVLLLTGLSCKKKQDNPSQSAQYAVITTKQYKQINGVAANLLSLDLHHFGKTGPLQPVVIYVHGGAYALGDKANSMDNKRALFASLGYLLVSVNYRLSPAVYSTDPNRVRYPMHHEDLADAIRWVYDSIANYGGNPTKMALLGHSAGAQLVALTGVSQQFLPARQIPLATLKGVACFDTEGYDVAAQCRDGNEVYLNAFGTDPLIWAQASPINHPVSSIRYPTFFIAKRGTNQRIALSDAFIQVLSNGGATVSSITANQYDHEGINDAIGKPGETIVTDPLKTFLARCFQ